MRRLAFHLDSPAGAAGSASVVDIDPSHWPADTRREFNTHLAFRGLPPNTEDPVRALRTLELARAQTLDARVTEKQLDQLVALSAKAAQLVPYPQEVFFGFTRLIDAKFDCTPKLLQGLVDRVLAEGSMTPDALVELIERGPPGGELVWTRPETPAELIASIVRQPAHSAATSIPLNMSNDNAQWLERSLEQIGKPLRLAMGGAAGFGANIAATLNALTPEKIRGNRDVLGVDFYAWDDHAQEIAQLFSPGVRMLDKSGARCPPEQRVSKSQIPRRNYVAGFPKKRAYVLRVGDHVMRIDPIASGGRFVLSTPAEQTTTFGDLSPAALHQIAEAHDTFFMSGLHYLSNSIADAEALRAQLEQIRRANPHAFVHFEYVKAKTPENEALLMRTLAGGIDSLSLNPGSELMGLLRRLSEAGMVSGAWSLDPSSSSAVEDAERPDTMLEAGHQLMHTLGLSRLHLHALTGDLLIADDIEDPDRQVLALLRARQVVAMKASNLSGEIKIPFGRRREIWPVQTTFPGEHLAAEHAFADAMQERFGLSNAERDHIVSERWHRDERTGRTYVFAPSRGMRDKRGGTVGAGDTIDLVALLLGRGPEGRPKETPRGD